MKITCDVIQDLLPLYVDEAVSEDSRVLVEEHLKDCEVCRKEEEQLRAGLGAFEDVETGRKDAEEAAAAFLKIRRSIWRKRVLSVCVAVAVVLAAVRGWHYYYYEKKTYLSLEESGLEMRGDKLYATKTYYGRMASIVSPDQKIMFWYCYETPEIRNLYPSEACDIMLKDFRAPFQMTEEELAEEDQLRIEKLYYLPEDFDFWKVYDESDYHGKDPQKTAEKTEMLESISALLWDVENGAAEDPDGAEEDSAADGNPAEEEVPAADGNPVAEGASAAKEDPAEEEVPAADGNPAAEEDPDAEENPAVEEDPDADGNPAVEEVPAVKGNPEAAEDSAAKGTSAVEEAPENTVGGGFVPPEGSRIDKRGNIVDPEGNTFNSRGQWQVPEGGHVDSQGRIYDKNGKLMGGGATIGSVG